MAQRATFIQAAIPKDKGPARHIETDGLAMTSYRIRDGQPEVEEIHTPQATLQRVHEVMHARHSTGLGAAKDYPGVNRNVAEIVEDCRLHLLHWPWGYHTPPEIAKDVRASLNAEIKASQSERAKKMHPFARFGTNLRAQAVSRGAGLCVSGHFEDHKQRDLAEILLNYITDGQHQLAAAMIHKMFYPPEDGDDDKAAKKKAERDMKYRLDPDGDTSVFARKPSPPGDSEDKDDPVEEMLARTLGVAACTMEILPLTEPTIGTTDGWRMATTGSRIHRPSLRRQVLPQRLFMKRSPQEPGGAIIFDGSSSMHISNDVLKECCRRAPTASVAFYRGNDHNKGKIWVFAYNGMRAKGLGKEAEVYPQGNSVDGQAMDWLMAQDGPRIMVTDRSFCGSGDSTIQIQRLRTLEERGEITVYKSYQDYMEAYPVSSNAV